MERLGMLMRRRQEYKGCNIIYSTKTWLHEHILDSKASLHEFQMIQVDRDIRSSGKIKGGAA